MAFFFSKIKAPESRTYWEKWSMDIIIIITTPAQPLWADSWERRSRGSPFPHCRFPASSSGCTGWGEIRYSSTGWSPSPLCKNTIVKKLETGEVESQSESRLPYPFLEQTFIGPASGPGPMPGTRNTEINPVMTSREKQGDNSNMGCDSQRAKPCSAC